jgi:hypothetical protein
MRLCDPESSRSASHPWRTLELISKMEQVFINQLVTCARCQLNMLMWLDQELGRRLLVSNMLSERQQPAPIEAVVVQQHLPVFSGESREDVRSEPIVTRPTGC